MNAMAASARRHDESELHEIRVQGHLDDRWADWMAGLTFTHERDGTTTLTGPLADQAALHGVLNRIRDLNAPIISVRRVCPESGRSTTMQAIVQDTYGSTDVLQLREIDKPVIGDDDVLVRVHAAGVHIGDVHVMTGLPYLMRIMGFGLRAPKAHVRGTDFAGVVEAVGNNVRQFQVGDEVFGTCDGSFAEYARARADQLAPKPANLTFEQAAAIPTSAVVALHGLRHTGEVQTGQRVLVIGASGGVGIFAVQIARAFGAEVTGVCSTKKVDMVRSIGADHVIDYTRQDFTRTGQQYDLILDTGGNRRLSDLRRALTRRGALVMVGGEGGDRWIGGALWRNLRALLLSPFVSQRLRPMVAWANAQDLHVLKDLVEVGKITPIIERTYSLSETPDAIRHVQQGHAVGKVVITVAGAAAERPE